jgi:NhaP-type Na+/H+ or K+/H+ antiporter
LDLGASATARQGWITELWSRLIVASLAVTCFAAAQWVGGSGLIAAFLGGLVFGAVVVGPVLLLLTWQTVLYAALSLMVVRMVPVFLSLLGSGISTRGKLSMGWFGPARAREHRVRDHRGTGAPPQRGGHLARGGRDGYHERRRSRDHREPLE